MYTKAESAQIKTAFWTAFGQYMKPITNAEGEYINWVNYKTGVKHIYFRLDVDKRLATAAIEIAHPDETLRRQVFEQFESLKKIFTDTVGTHWDWHSDSYDEFGKPLSRISLQLAEVSVFKRDTWPAIIAFFKENIILLDTFWSNTKPLFE